MPFNFYALILGQLVPFERRRPSTPPAPGPSASTNRYGCCPSCGEFVSIPPAHPAYHVPCPSCGQPIGAFHPLRPLGSEEIDEGPPVRKADIMWDRELDA